MAKRRLRQSKLLPTSPLLITESQDEFDRIRDALEQELRPRGIVEKMFVADIVHLVWEILRLRRCKAGIINSAFRAALANLLAQAAREPGTYACEIEEKADELAHGWLSDPKTKEKVLAMLREVQLDESAIEAEAIRSVAADLELLDRLLASLESRRNKALRCIADYRGDLAQRLRRTGDRIIDGQVVALENASRKKPAAAA
jgi:hypothetical protein